MGGFFISGLQAFYMNELLAAVPYLTAAGVATLVAFLRGTLTHYPPSLWLRVCDSLICGFGAVAVAIMIKNHVSSYSAGDSIAIAFGIGYLGAGKVTDLAVAFARKKLNIEEPRHEP